MCNIDTAGGLIKPGPNATVFYNGQPLAVVGCPVEPHGPGPHIAAVMVEGSAMLFINGIAVCLAGSKASCDHQATGRPNFTASV